MSTPLQNAINIIDDILSKVDEFAKQAPAPAVAAAGAQATGDGAATKKRGKKKDKKTPAAAAENEQSSDPFAMADLRVSAFFRLGSAPSCTQP